MSAGLMVDSGYEPMGGPISELSGSGLGELGRLGGDEPLALVDLKGHGEPPRTQGVILSICGRALGG